MVDKSAKRYLVNDADLTGPILGIDGNGKCADTGLEPLKFTAKRDERRLRFLGEEFDQRHMRGIRESCGFSPFSA
jgi:hypothetical protein